VQCKYGIDCFADDTGLEIEALGGKPGVRSARYAGEDCNADNNIKKVLAELKGEHNRKARFRTVICLIEDGRENYFEGIVEGRIIDEKRGKEGFGYDPVFIPDGYSTTFAEMPLNAKNSISHRGRAIASLMAWLTRQGSPR
jgi:XTP/dITP diphosphohydrolase